MKKYEVSFYLNGFDLMYLYLEAKDINDLKKQIKNYSVLGKLVDIEYNEYDY